jgi:curli biogenesis system outer membrane secretion channel CsgG
VLPFEDAPGMYGVRSGTAVCGFVTGELARSRTFRIVERSKLKTIMNEQDLQGADLVDADTAVKIGKMLGVQAVIVGSVCQYEMDKTTVYIHVIPIVKKDYSVGASIRMIDVGNGEIIYAHSASGASPANFAEAGKLAAKKLLDPLVNRT